MDLVFIESPSPFKKCRRAARPKVAERHLRFQTYPIIFFASACMCYVACYVARYVTQVTSHIKYPTSNVGYVGWVMRSDQGVRLLFTRCVSPPECHAACATLFCNDA